MHILFLGTGAADHSEADRFSPGYRRNSSLLIDETILIDPGLCVPEAIAHFQVDPAKIKYILCTHLHEDHFDRNTLTFLQQQGGAVRFIRKWKAPADWNVHCHRHRGKPQHPSAAFYY